jgi:tetratricopeptide (TPR) repeat protein
LAVRNGRGKKGSFENDINAREHFEKAIEIQPDYSLAYSGMSLTYFNEWSCQLWERWNISKSGAYQWAQKAIELDDQNYVAALIAEIFAVFICVFINFSFLNFVRLCLIFSWIDTHL